MYVVHVTRDLDAAGGGPSRSIPDLARAVAEKEHIRVSVVFQDRGQPMTVDASEAGPDYRPVKRGGSYLNCLRNDLRGINRGTPIDLIHVHGLWSPTVHQCVRYAQQEKIPYIVAPRGMLSGACLQAKPIRKRLAWRGYQKSDLQQARCLHVTSECERDDCVQLISAPTALIPNGCRIREIPRQMTNPAVQTRLAVCIGRIDRVKAIEDLIVAWAHVQPRGWSLAIAGTGDLQYLQQLTRQVTNSRLASQVRFLGELNEQQKWELLETAELFVSSSKSENFGVAIAEALGSGTPVITTRGAPWACVEHVQAGWWVPADAESIATALKTATGLSRSDLKRMGKRGRELVRDQFSWNRIAADMLQVYQWSVEGNNLSLPKTIRL